MFAAVTPSSAKLLILAIRMTPSNHESATTFRFHWACGLVLLGVLTWTYGSVLAELVNRWSADPQYSHGYIVPLIAAALVWRLRARLSRVHFTPCAWGLAILSFGLIVHTISGRYYYEWSDAISLIPCVAGIVMLIGGWPLLRLTWPAVAFLAFMIPLPYRIESAMAGPLQAVATVSSTFVLQTMGFPASAEGNTIAINDIRVGVAEACSGLRMLVVFFAISTAVAISIRKSRIEKSIVILSAFAISICCNVIRISATGMLLATSQHSLAKLVYHDLAGWLMMPLALALLWLELKFLGHLIIETRPTTTPRVLAQLYSTPSQRGDDALESDLLRQVAMQRSPFDIVSLSAESPDDLQIVSIP